MSAPVAIVTGAGSGIGRATAIALAAKGHRVALVGRRAARLAETAELIRGAGAPDNCMETPADLADPDAIRVVVKSTVGAWGRVDTLVNNAAVCPNHPVGGTNPALLQETFAANFFGAALLVARLWPVFLTQHGGCVVNVSSVSTVDPFPGLSVYAATKAALESLTRSIAIEGRDHGIRAFSLVLGAIETDMLRSIVTEAQYPRSQTLEPQDVAVVVVDCVTGRLDSQSGGVIEVAKT